MLLWLVMGSNNRQPRAKNSRLFHFYKQEKIVADLFTIVI